ncbi:MAG: GNAT family N-acetyltransferase [Oscillospiraceae bacterium]|nr:GNAT family N-acetyltransferase [Oscillospiraceae bacterium]
MGYQIREITAGDDRAMEGIIRRCLTEFGGAQVGGIWNDPELAGLSEAYSAPGSRYWVAEDTDGTVLGGAGIRPLAEDDGLCELQKLCCPLEVRGTGVANRLMDTALTFARQHYDGCRLETSEAMAAAQQFCAKFGFLRLNVPVGQTARFTRGVRYQKDFRRRGAREKVTVAEIMQKMIRQLDGNLRDIQHMMKVWTYAKTIGELEDLDTDTQRTLEIAAILHDIACPLCREKYHNVDGKNQERESAPLVQAFLADVGLPKHIAERVCYLVSHHHTVKGIDGRDYQILIEADYFVNAEENRYTQENVAAFVEKVFRTPSAIAFAKSLYHLE